MKSLLHIFKTPEELALAFADQLMSWINDHPNDTFHLAVSGGKTPDLLFSVLASKYLHSNLWQKVHFWWVDERMVSAEHVESNFGTINNLLLSKISIPKENIHSINGENDPETEARSYSEQIRQHVPLQNGYPCFDLVLLGMGDDGHTASIFPDQLQLFESQNICEVAVHPQTGQKRITLTGHAINQASKVCFIVTGNTKSDRLTEIWKHKEKSKLLPAAYVHPINGTLFWYVDKEAVKTMISKSLITKRN